MVAFTTALYYPSIDIEDEGWLKNAMLYWDRILTIVPASIKEPYKNSTAKAFSDAGLLIPIYVTSETHEVIDLTSDVKKYLRTKEGKSALNTREEERLERLYPDKLSYEIQTKMENALYSDRFKVKPPFANFYMTLLATRLSEKKHAGLLTHTESYCNLSNLVRCNSTQIAPSSLAQGLLVSLMFDKVKIDPDTPVEKILKFREKHIGDLGHFRMEVDKLTEVFSQPIQQTTSFEQLSQQVRDLYLSSGAHSIESFKEGLTDNRI